MNHILKIISVTILVSVVALSQENNASETKTVDDAISFFTFTGMSKDRSTYPPILKNDQNLSEYKWNALETEWVNAYAVIAIAMDRSIFSQGNDSLAHVESLDPFDKGEIRAIRIGAVGTINFERPWTWAIAGASRSWDQGFDTTDDETFTLFDVAIGIPLWGEYARFQIGKMKEPMSLERSMGMTFEQLMERPMHLDALLPARNTGISASDMIFDDRVTWRAGIFNNWIEQDDVSFSEMSNAYVGRVTAVAYEDKEAQRLLHLGAGYRYSDAKLGYVQYRTGPEQSFVGKWVDTGAVIADGTGTTNLEMTYLDGPLWLAAEYTSVAVDSSTIGDPTFGGYHVAANYMLTGEHRGYNKRRAVVRRVIPDSDFTSGGWGAVGLSARYSTLDLSDGLIEGGEMQVSTVGIAWYTQKASQFHLQWSRAHLESYDLATKTIPLQSDTDIVQFRWVYLLD